MSEKCCCGCGSKSEQFKELQPVLDQYAKVPGSLITILQKAQEIYVLPASFGWSDLGTWGALRGLLPQDKSGNAMVGTDIRLYESKNCIVHTSEEKRVVIQGLDGYIIAEKDDTLLICKLEEEQRIKEFSK